MQSPRERARRLERVLALAQWKLEAAQHRREEIARALAYARGELEQLAELGTRAVAMAALAPLLLAAAHKRRTVLEGLLARLEQQAVAQTAECMAARRRAEIVGERLATARRLERGRQADRQLGEDVIRRSTPATPGQASARMVGRAGASAEPAGAGAGPSSASGEANANDTERDDRRGYRPSRGR